jgi:class 3 adenylate cyclase
VAEVVPPAVHRTVVCVDVEGFADRRRTDRDQVVVRGGVYRVLQRAFAASGLLWRDCYREDRGDGVLVLVPPEVPKALLVTVVPGQLAAALAEHNWGHRREARIRLRMAVHAGEIRYDQHGVAGTAINLAARLVDADAARRALGGSRGVLAVIASRWFFEEVIRHDPAAGPATYRQVQVSVKETRERAWISLPDDPYPPEADGWLPPAPPAGLPRQLPGAVCGFAGREAQLRELTRLLDPAGLSSLLCKPEAVVSLVVLP